MKKFILLCGLLVSALSAFAAAPTGRVSGVLVDGDTGEPVIGAVVEMNGLGGLDAARQQMTDIDGRFALNDLAYGRYEMKFTFLGYKELVKTVAVNGASVDLGTLKLEVESTAIEAVVLEVPAMRTSQKGDTVVYNAAAFKVASDADTETLLAKMPGVMIGADGTVEAQGEEIKKILVDGKEFFGDDVSTAIKNLPAEVVENVEIFNKLSDQAEFTGLDDGEGYKAINIVTNVGKRRGVFGKLYASYGYPEYYTAGGNVNLFSGDTRLSLIGMANNINQQNFSFEDILGVVNTGGNSTGGGGMRMGRGGGIGGYMVRPLDGISTIQSVGLNFSDTWGKRDGVEVTASYFFNHNANRNVFTNEVWQDPGTQYDYETGSSRAQNYNHRFNARLDYKINDNQSLMIRPSFSYQNYSSWQQARTDISNLTEEEAYEQLKSILNGTDDSRTGYNAGLTALYRLKLGKPGRTLTVNLNGRYSKNDQLELIDEYYYMPQFVEGAVADSVANQRIGQDTYTYHLEAGATYTEPLSRKSLVSLEYRATYDYSDAQKLTYLWDPLEGIISPQFDDQLSTINNSGYLTHRVGPGYRYSDGKANISASLMYQYATLDNNTLAPSTIDPYVRYNFNNLVYAVMTNINFDQQNTLRIHLRSRTENPSVTQLQDVPDFSNTTYVQGGNAALVPAYKNTMHAFYINSNVPKGQTFTVMFGAEYTTDYIGDSIVTYHADRPFVIPNSDQVLQPGQRYSRYANLGSSWLLRGGLGYGLPVRFLASNLNFNVGVMLAQTPNVIDGEKFMRNESYFNGGVQLSSNINENIDFTIMYNGSYNIASSVAQGVRTQNRFINQYASANIKWVFWKGFTFTGAVTYNQYKGITSNYNEQYVLCNLYIGKKIFRNQLGEVSIGVNDLLNQNTSFRRTVESSYIQNSTNLAIGRYFSVQFVYNLRAFSKGVKASDYDNFDKGARRPPMGPPPPFH